MVVLGLFDYLKAVYDPFFGLFVVGFVSWFVIVCGMSKKNIFRGCLDEEKNPDY